MERTTVSSKQLALGAATTDAIVRRDMLEMGISGTRGVGYDVGTLIEVFRRELGVEKDRRIVIIGVGHLGTALANYAGFDSAGFHVIGLYDTAPRKIGSIVSGHVIQSLDELPEDVADVSIETIAIIAVPAKAAQTAAETVVRAGITSILNFAPKTLHLDPAITVRHVDLSTELQLLSYFS
jgi:redox-sensing transcriptional repressor